MLVKVAHKRKKISVRPHQSNNDDDNVNVMCM